MQKQRQLSPFDTGESRMKFIQISSLSLSLSACLSLCSSLLSVRDSIEIQVHSLSFPARCLVNEGEKREARKHKERKKVEERSHLK